MIDARNITVSILSRGQLTQDNNQKMVVDGLATLEKVADRIRTSRKLKAQTAALREKLLKGGRKGEYQRAKLRVARNHPRCAGPHWYAPGETATC